MFCHIIPLYPFNKSSKMGITIPMLTIQQMIKKLDSFWQSKGCMLLPPYDLEKGAGTFNPATFLYSLGKEKANVAYVEPSRRPTDGRYGQNPNRFFRNISDRFNFKDARESTLQRSEMECWVFHGPLKMLKNSIFII